MTGSTTPWQAEPGSQASQHCRSGLPGLEAILQQRWNEVVPKRDPRLYPGKPAEAPLPQSLAARLQILAPAESGLTAFLERLESALRFETAPGDALDADAELDADTPLGLAPPSVPQACMQALVQDFSRRQRQATMLVAGCISASCVLTVVGIAALASVTGPSAGRSEGPSYHHTSSTAWQPPSPASAVTSASASPNRSGKSDSLFVLARLSTAEPAPRLRTVFLEQRASRPELILMRAGRPLSLAPLIEPRQASYLLIRGLPNEARLSAGQRSPSGAWLVKAEDVAALTLSIADDAGGDYTAEIYALGAGDVPQARQRLVLRVDPIHARTAASETSNDMAAGHTKILASLSD